MGSGNPEGGARLEAKLGRSMGRIVLLAKGDAPHPGAEGRLSSVSR